MKRRNFFTTAIGAIASFSLIPQTITENSVLAAFEPQLVAGSQLLFYGHYKNGRFYIESFDKKFIEKQRFVVDFHPDWNSKTIPLLKKF